MPVNKFAFSLGQQGKEVLWRVNGLWQLASDALDLAEIPPGSRNRAMSQLTRYGLVELRGGAGRFGEDPREVRLTPAGVLAKKLLAALAAKEVR